MGLWKFLKWTFQKRDTTSGEDFGLSVFQRESVDMFSLACWEGGPHGYSLWLEIWPGADGRAALREPCGMLELPG